MPRLLKPSSPKPVTIYRIFGVPLVVKGNTWFPLAQLIAWGILSILAGKRRPERSWAQRLGVGALTMPVFIGSEWCHNLAHAAAAQAVGKPMDEMRILGGLPRVVYFDLEDTTVTPHQHILRALGGPIFNALMFGLTSLLRRRTSPGSLGREVADLAVNTNAFIGAVSLVPIPGIDGGLILKWSLVGGGCTPAEADQVVRQVDGVMSVGLGAASVVALKKHHWAISGLY